MKAQAVRRQMQIMQNMALKGDGKRYYLTLSYYHQKCQGEGIRICISLVCPKY